MSSEFGQPSAEVSVDATLVSALLERHYPRLAAEPLSYVDDGWDNVTFRVGNDHAVRLPRRQAAVDLILNEQRWLPAIARRLPVSVPGPVCAAPASDLFPWPWSVVEWIPGITADMTALGAGHGTALARVLQALHRPAPDGAPFNPYRGVPLHARRTVVEERLERLARLEAAEMAKIRSVWEESLEAPPARHRRWLHGDLHPRNLVVRNGKVAGIIDWGDVTAGDVATDVACAWMIVDSPTERARFLEAYGPSRSVVTRARGWAVSFASAMVASEDPRHVPIGMAALARLLSPDEIGPREA